MDLLPVRLIEVAKILEAGWKKYAARNWEKGIPLSRYMDSGLRHAMKWLRGDRDEPHLAMAIWNLMCLQDTQLRIAEGLLPAGTQRPAVQSHRTGRRNQEARTEAETWLIANAIPACSTAATSWPPSTWKRPARSPDTMRSSRSPLCRWTTTSSRLQVCARFTPRLSPSTPSRESAAASTETQDSDGGKFLLHAPESERVKDWWRNGSRGCGCHSSDAGAAGPQPGLPSHLSSRRGWAWRWWTIFSTATPATGCSTRSR